MKALKFTPELSQLILDGKKTTTWRLFDDKDLKDGDIVTCLNSDTLGALGQAELRKVKVTSLGNLDESDWEGHEKFDSEEEMYKTYSSYYRRLVDGSTEVKIIKFDFKKK